MTQSEEKIIAQGAEIIRLQGENNGHQAEIKKLIEKNNSLLEKTGRQQDEIKQLQRESNSQKAEIISLRDENKGQAEIIKLLEKSTSQQDEIIKLQRESNSQKTEIIRLREANNGQQVETIRLQYENGVQQAKIIELQDKNNRQAEEIKLQKEGIERERLEREKRDKDVKEIIRKLQAAGATGLNAQIPSDGSTFEEAIGQMKKKYGWASENKMFVIGGVVVCIVGVALIVNYGPAVCSYVLAFGKPPPPTGFSLASFTAVLGSMMARVKSA